MMPLYECCGHCVLIQGECPDLAEEGGHLLPCEQCTDGAQVKEAIRATILEAERADRAGE